MGSEEVGIELNRLRLILALGGFILLGPWGSSAAQSVSLTHREFGSGSPLFVVLHGGPGASHEYLLPEWERLSDFGTVLFYDQRGSGANKDLPGPFGWRTHVSDLDALLSEHSEGRPVVLAGSSWGAHLALLHALRGEEEVQGIVLSGYPGWHGPDLLMPSERPMRLWPRLDSLEAGLLHPRVSAPDTLSSGEGIGAVIADSIVALRALPTVSPEVKVGVTASYPTMPAFQELLDVKVPVLIILGDQGRAGEPAAAADLAALAHEARQVVIRESGHDPWASDPKAFFEAVVTFVRELVRQ